LIDVSPSVTRFEAFFAAFFAGLAEAAGATWAAGGVAHGLRCAGGVILAGAALPVVLAGVVRPVALIGSGEVFLSGALAGSDDAAALVRLRGLGGACSSPIRTRVMRTRELYRARNAVKAKKLLLSPARPGRLRPSRPVRLVGYPLCPPRRAACILDRRRP